MACKEVMQKEEKFNMKKNILLTVFTLVVSVGVVFAQSRTMAVMPFDVVGDAVTADEVEALTELYTSALTDIGMMKIVDRTNFDKIMKELNFQSSDWSNSEKTAKLGQALNARFISRGKIMKLGGNLSISASIMDIRTAENVASIREKYRNIDQIVDDFFNYDHMKLLLLDVIVGLGPADGIIFNANGNVSYEVLFFSNKVSYKEALQKASNYSKSGYNDWHIPTMDEAKLIKERVFSKYPDKRIDFWVYGTSRDYKWKHHLIGNQTKEFFNGYNYCENGAFMRVTEGFSDSYKFTYCLVHSFTD